METLKQRLAEQQGRHQGGSKWIGTAGTSPFGAYGYNPEGVRIGQQESRHRPCGESLGQARFPRISTATSISARATSRSRCAACANSRGMARPRFSNLPGTVRATADNAGWLDLQLEARAAQRGQGSAVLGRRRIDGRSRPRLRRIVQRRQDRVSNISNRYYFHNCVYERVWKENARRWDAPIPTADVLHTYGPDYPAGLCRRRRDEPVRDRAARRFGRTLERRKRRSLDAPPVGTNGPRRPWPQPDAAPILGPHGRRRGCCARSWKTAKKTGCIR